MAIKTAKIREGFILRRNMSNGIRLFVDDIRKVPDSSWHLATTITEAIRILATIPVVEISLDHDISHDVKVGNIHRPYPCGETFEPVYRYLCAMDPALRPAKVTIHTANKAKVPELCRILEENGMQPEVRLGSPVKRE